MKKELIASVASLQHNMEQWMGELHEHPELSMKEHFTSKYIAAKVKEWAQ